LFDLQEQEEDFSANSDLLTMYSYDWINNLSRITSIWHLLNNEQQKLITQKYEEVKPIAIKLKLPWPEELSS